MSIIYMTIALSLLLALIFLVAFIWTVKNGQYDDEYSPSVRMLFEDKKAKKKNPEQKITNKQTVN